jgi:hypothetical protein
MIGEQNVLHRVNTQQPRPAPTHPKDRAAELREALQRELDKGAPPCSR